MEKQQHLVVLTWNQNITSLKCAFYDLCTRTTFVCLDKKGETFNEKRGEEIDRRERKHD